MRAFDSLRRPGDFTRLYRHGRRVHGSGLTVHLITRRPGPMLRVGIAISTAVGNAVRRNLLRRRLLAILDRCDTAQGRDLDVLIVAKPGAADLSFAELDRQLRNALPDAVAAAEAAPA